MKLRIITFLLLFITITVFAQKKPLTHDVYDGWKNLRSSQISNDGKWLMYLISPQKGDATLQIYDQNKKTYFDTERGSNPKFTYDNTHAIFKIKPHTDTIRTLKLKKVKSNKHPKDSLGIYTLKTGTLEKIPLIKSYQMPKKGGQYLAYMLHPDKSKNKKKKKEEKKKEEEEEKSNEAVETPEENPEKKKPKKVKKESSKNGHHLMIRNLTNGREDTVKYVLSYQFTEDGSKIVFSTTGVEDDRKYQQGIYVYDVPSGKINKVFSEKGKYAKLTWDDDGKQLAFIADIDTSKGHKDDPIKYYNVYHWKLGQGEATKIAYKGMEGLIPDWYINNNCSLDFAKNGSKLFFGTAPMPLQEDTTLLKEEKVKVDIWHYKDPFLQPQQKVNAKRAKNRTYTAVYDTRDKSVMQYGSEEVPTFIQVDEGNADFAIGLTNIPYGKYISWEGFPYYFDVHYYDLKNKKQARLLQKIHGNSRVSPNGKYLSWWSSRDTSLMVYNIEQNKMYNLTKGVDNQFWNETHDTPNHPYSYGTAGWTEDDASLLVYDRYDIWEFDPENKKSPVRITKNGRETKTSYRYAELDDDERFIKKGAKLLLKAVRDTDKAEGFYTITLGKNAAPKELLMDAYRFSYPTKAKDTDAIFITKQNFQTFPDIHCTNLKFKNLRKVSEANPQMKDYLWGSVEQTSWVNLDGVKLDGLIYKPENFDPNKKYPMMVYFYERSSNRLHSHYRPAPIRSIINITYFTSNDYVVFVPDIIYQDGFPGKSAYNCVIPGVLDMISKGYVDKDRIGVQGHSWGGYQIAYLVTKTNIFKCAEAGAPVSNMTSAYGGIRWASGLSRMFQYEHTQSRIGGTLWDKPAHYIENSPIFRADDIQTPLLLLHNDNDGAVPWYQGIELFVGLRRLGKPTWMINYNGEGHGVRKRHNQVDFAKRMYQFFDYYLKDAPMPEWMESGIPATEKGLNMGLEPKN